jgi:hypothetical protein
MKKKILITNPNTSIEIYTTFSQTVATTPHCSVVVKRTRGQSLQHYLLFSPTISLSTGEPFFATTSFLMLIIKKGRRERMVVSRIPS